MAKNHQGGGHKRQVFEDPLAPMRPKQLRRQAMTTERAIYKPAFKQLQNEQRRITSISNKRKSDNTFYLNWLNTQNQQIQAHEDAANAQLLAAGKESQAEVEKGYQDMRTNLVSTGEATPGVVSNPGEAKAFDVSAEHARASEQVAAERQRSQELIQTRTPVASEMAANNFAQIASLEANRLGDQWKALSKLGDSRQQLRLSKAADTAKEVSRLLDREIEKAQIRGQEAASIRQAALEAKRFGLDVKKLNLDIAEFQTKTKQAGRKLGLEEGKFSEEKRWHNIQSRLKGAANRQDQQKANHQATSVIQEGISWLSSRANENHKHIAKMLQTPDGRRQVVKRLGSKSILGSPLAAQAAVQLFTEGGKLSPQMIKRLKTIGYTPPKAWR